MFLDVPFSFSQPHCTSTLIRKENGIASWSPPALGQLEGCSLHSCSDLPSFQPNTKAPTSNKGHSWGSVNDKSRECGWRTNTSSRDFRNSMLRQTSLSITLPHPCVHAPPQRPAYQRFVSDQESLGQRTFMGLKHHTIHLQLNSLLFLHCKCKVIHLQCCF